MTGAEQVPSVGLVLPPAAPPQQLWPAVELAERGGIGSIWVTDRTVSDMPWLEAQAFLAALAARTSTVTIGTCVLCVARRNPVYTAHALATAQFLSGGRVVAGIGLGGLRPEEFTLAGVRLDRRAPVTDVYIDLLRRIWSTGQLDYDGPDYACSGVTIAPRPEPMIPILVGGNSPGAYRRAGTLGDGWLSVFAGPVEFAAAWEQITAHAVDAGRDPAALLPAAYVFAAIGRRDGEAEAVLDPAMRAIFGSPLGHLDFTCIHGTPEQWVDRIRDFGAHGARQVNTLLFSTDLVRDVELVVSEVLPRLGVPVPA
ncbi:LLM class flavin-dependent oxidoreductase [Blastococcus sp. SYSU D00820]